MNKSQYLKELESLLLDINDNDRQEALDYYSGYFDEAGIENEERTINELGSPQKLAYMIRDSLNGQFDDSIEIGNDGIKTDKYEYKNEVKEVSEKRMIDKGDKVIFLILLLALFIPFTAVAGSLFGILGIFLSIVMFFFGFWIMTIILYVIGACCIAAGVLSITTTLGASLIVVGIGLILIVLGNLIGKIATWFFKTVIPYFIDCIRRIFNRLTNREVTA